MSMMITNRGAPADSEQTTARRKSPYDPGNRAEAAPSVKGRLPEDQAEIDKRVEFYRHCVEQYGKIGNHWWKKSDAKNG